MGWWKRKKQGPDTEDLQRELQAARHRLAQVDAEIRRKAAEQEIEQLKHGPQADGT